MSLRIITLLFTAGLMFTELSDACPDAFLPSEDPLDPVAQFIAKSAELRASQAELSALMEAKPKGRKKRRKHQQHRAELDAKIEALENTIAVLRVPSTQEMRRRVSKKLHDRRFGSYVREGLLISRIHRFKREKTVSINVGTAGAPTSLHELVQVRTLVKGLLRRGYNIIYDADSPALSFIRRSAPNRSLGISLNVSHHPSVASVHNPYVKFAILAHPKHIIVSPSSTVGAGLLAFQRATMVLDPSGEYQQALPEWQAYLYQEKIFIGLEFAPYFPYSSAEKLLGSVYSKNGPPTFPDVTPQTLPQSTNLDLLRIEVLFQIDQYAKSMAIDGTDLRRQQGAVVFGSSGLHRSYAAQTYMVGRHLARKGYPVITGGAGGMMLAANMGAFDAGGDSIGIPIAGRKQLSNETVIHTEVHTHTIPTPDYFSRVGLLLENVKYVVLVPGRSGTMRELATALVKLAANPESAPPIVFVNKQYYNPLYKWLTESNVLPRSVRTKIHIADTEAELDAIIANTAASPAADARSERANFPLDMKGLIDP